jgi:hypothetical protein
MRIYIGLVHYPVYNKRNETIASAITTFDLHDMARLGKTYGARKLMVITPLEDQQALAERVRRHWTEGYGARYNVDRKEAMGLLEVQPSLERALMGIAEREGEAALLIATDASEHEKRSISYERAARILRDETVVFLIFGTAWGLGESVITMADYVLEPVFGRSAYNHLSVRTAAAVILDRLAGRQNRTFAES